MAKAHFKCVGRAGISAVKHPTYTSRAWDITEEDARRLVGGKIYFHESKSEPSYFGGLVMGYEVIKTDLSHSKRIVFTLEAQADCKGVPWGGANHVMAHYSGVIE